MPFTRMPTFLLGCVGAVLWHQGGGRFVAYMNRGRVALKSWGMIAAGLVILGLVEWGPKRELAYAPGKWCVRGWVVGWLVWWGWCLGVGVAWDGVGGWGCLGVVWCWCLGVGMGWGLLGVGGWLVDPADWMVDGRYMWYTNPRRTDAIIEWTYRF